MTTVRRRSWPGKSSQRRASRVLTILIATLAVPAASLCFAGSAVAEKAHASHPVLSSRHGGHIDFGVAGTPSTAGDAGGPTVTVQPVTTHLSDGSIKAVYALPDGETITDITPPASFNPLTASEAQLKKYGFPVRPSSASAARAWQTAMAAYRSDTAQTGPIQVQTGPNKQSSVHFGPKYGTNWGGYTAGLLRQQLSTYVAVQTVFATPSESGCSDSNIVGLWVGLGGTNNGANDLVQQGIECGDSSLGSGSVWRPFTQFFTPQNPPVNFCGLTSWAFPAGHTLYQNMSFEASSNKANFYMEDESSGSAHSCTESAPSGWGYNGNTADWIGEAPTWTAEDFSSVAFSDAYAELGSNGSWVPFASQTNYNEWVDGESSSTYCIDPGGVGSDEASFTDYWHQATCVN